MAGRNGVAEKRSHGLRPPVPAKVRRKGLIFMGFRAGRAKRWRRPVGWLAAYALVLQLMAGALAVAQVSAQAAAGNWSFFEICYGKGVAADELPEGVPAKHASQCAVCVLAAGGAALTPEAAAAAVPAFAVSETRWVARANQLARRDAAFSQRQRAPPAAA